MNLKCILSCFLITLLFFSGCSIGDNFEYPQVDKESHIGVKKVTIATGGVSGTYFSIGSGISAIMTKYVDNLEAIAESTGASVANSKLLRDGFVDFMLASASTIDSAYYGKDVFEGNPAKNIVGIASLYPEVFQFIVLKSSDMRSVSDLVGKRVAVGSVDSGTERISKIILSAHGISYNDIDEQFLGFSEAVDALKDGKTDCIIIASGLPTSAVVDISAVVEIALLDVDKLMFSEVLPLYPFLKFETIEEGIYSSVNRDTLSISTPALLATSITMEEEIVYNITKAIFEHVDELESIHSQAKNIRLNTAISAMPVPLHPGAERYYREVGILDSTD